MRIDNTEAPVVKAVLDLLALRGIVAWRVNTGKLSAPGGRLVRFGVVGHADVQALIPPHGRALFVECKRPDGGRLTESQKYFLGRAKDLGAVAIVVSDVAVLARVLDRLQADPFVRLTLGGLPE